MQALHIYAGPRAQAHLLERGLTPDDVRVIPAAAGGPKGLVLNALDRALFGHWLRGSTQTRHLIGASIGAWRMAAACLPDPDAALLQLADDYVTQAYPHRPGKQPKPHDISRIFGATLEARLGTRAAEILSHPHQRLHVITSRGRSLLKREGRMSTPIGYAGAFAANIVKRQAMGAFLERVTFSDARSPLPFPLDDYPSRQVPLTATNLAASVLASCSIPFWLEAVQDVPGGPPGAYWDGGITDYHLHLDYRAMPDGLVLYPHFQATVVPGWLDKVLKHRHVATARLDPVVLLTPNPEWIKTVLPGGKLPDRGDFKAYGEYRVEERQRDWRRAISAGQRLADEFLEAVQRPSIQARPLL
jgi:Patatin-like phospholipase